MFRHGSLVRRPYDNRMKNRLSIFDVKSAIVPPAMPKAMAECVGTSWRLISAQVRATAPDNPNLAPNEVILSAKSNWREVSGDSPESETLRLIEWPHPSIGRTQ